jgi:hypothetical protein
MVNFGRNQATSFSKWLVGTAGVVSALATTLLATPARASVPLTRANVEAILNRVELVQRGRSARPARTTDFMSVGDALRTAAASRAELRFNDGSLARVGERATFQFVPNTRNFRLSDGTLLLLIPPNRGRSVIETPSAVTGIQGSAVVVRHIQERDLTVVMALTNNPDGPMAVTILDCAEGGVADNCATEYALYAGQMALIQHGRVQVLDFDLHTFYETSPLIEGLDLDNSESDVSLGGGLDEVRAETLAALEEHTPFTEADTAYINPDMLSVFDGDQVATTPWLITPQPPNTVTTIRPNNFNLPPAGAVSTNPNGQIATQPQGVTSPTGSTTPTRPVVTTPVQTPTVPSAPQPPTQTPTVPTTPQTPTQTPTIPSTPQPPTQTPTVPSTPQPPTQTPTIPSTPQPPTQTPTIPSTPQPPTQTPTIPSTPQTPAPTPEVPQTPAPTPEVPQTPAPTPEVPQTPAPTPEVPQTPAPTPEVPQTPAPTPEVPQTPEIPSTPEPSTPTPEVPQPTEPPFVPPTKEPTVPPVNVPADPPPFNDVPGDTGNGNPQPPAQPPVNFGQ